MTKQRRSDSFLYVLLIQSVLVGFAILPAAAHAGGIIEAGEEIPSAREVDKTLEYIKDCGPEGHLHCYPILAEEGGYSRYITGSESYKSWSLFLVCTPSLLRYSSAASLADLFEQFMAFGKAIGRDNAAVWFVKKKTGIKNSLTQKNLDVNRSEKYCSKFKLDREEGPHVVVTSDYPALKDNIGYDIVLSLGGMNDKSIEKLLDALATQVGNEELDQNSMDYKTWSQKLKQAFDRAVASVGDAVANSKVTIKVRGIEASVEPAEK